MLTDLATMSWRRFCVLIRGLSPNSATVTSVNSARYMGRKRGDTASVAPVRREDADAAFRGLFAGRAKIVPSRRAARRRRLGIG